MGILVLEVLFHEEEKFEEVGRVREHIPPLKIPTRRIRADTHPHRVLLLIRSGPSARFKVAATLKVARVRHFRHPPFLLLGLRMKSHLVIIIRLLRLVVWMKIIRR